MLKLKVSAKSLFPKIRGTTYLSFNLDGKESKLLYDGDERRIRTLTKWFKKHNPNPGDIAIIEVIEFGKKYRMSLERNKLNKQ